MAPARFLDATARPEYDSPPMQIPQVTPTEKERIALLRGCGILDTAPDSDFDGLASLAASIAETPIALVSLVDEERQWFKAHHGLDATETPREMAFCAHTILDPNNPFVVPDARLDPRFSDNPLVTGRPHVIFYVGIPLLVGSDRLPLGTLCVLAPEARQIPPAKLAQLQLLARQAEQLLELRLQQKQIEAHLLAQQQSATQLGAIISAMNEGLVVQDRQSRILSCNPAAERILGLSADQICGRSSLDPSWQAVRKDGSPFPGEDHPAMVTLRTGRAVSGVVMGVGLAGKERRWILINAQPVQMGADGLPDTCVATFTDITNLRREEEERQRAQGQVDRFFSISLELLCIAGMDGRFQRLNPAWTSLLGWSEEDLAGRPFIDFVHPEDVSSTLEEAARLSEGGITTHFENRYRCSNGTYRVIQWSVVGVPKEGIMMAAARDITEERQHRAKLKEAAEAAEAANLAKSAFLATMSHEIRTPLNGVLGLAELLALTPLDSQQSELLETIRSSGQLLLRVINDVLDWSKIQAGGMEVFPEKVSLSAVAKEALDSLRPNALKKGLSLSLVDQTTEYSVLADPQRLRQILGNLLGNAIKFTDHGSVTLQISRSSAGQVVVEVRDSGIGIATEDLPHLFTSFTQINTETNRQFGGTGLGLAVSLKLAQAMDGDIKARSTLGHGSTFTLTLPAAPTDTAPLSHSQPLAVPDSPRPNNQPLRILLVEDNPTNQIVAAGMLHNLGHSVEILCNGAQAVQTDLSEFDVVLMDIQTPVMDGLEATKQIRSRQSLQGTRRLPIVALTASALHEQRQACFDADMDGVITKPVTRKSLAEALASIVPMSRPDRG